MATKNLKILTCSRKQTTGPRFGINKNEAEKGLDNLQFSRLPMAVLVTQLWAAWQESFDKDMLLKMLKNQSAVSRI